MTERFHIGEWYGQSFLDLSDAKRVEYANHKVGGSAMSKADILRMAKLEAKLGSGGLSLRERERLDALRDKLEEQNLNEKPCPFRTDSLYPTCTKKGGVCSLRLISDEGGTISGVPGERGMLRAMCPYRFHEGNTVFKHIGERLLGDSNPIQLGEVGFLESTGNLDSAAGADVGNIDMILVTKPKDHENILQWAAVEIQAVYFSGKEMPIEFRHLKSTDGALSLPVENRRPDYRSSGPKRLMPQLQIKVPTLRRWGKKMAIVVDVPFFKSMGEMRTVTHISNSDIVWFLVDFVQSAPGSNYTLQVVDEVFTTLEASIEGLTGGVPVPLEEFETRIRARFD